MTSEEQIRGEGLEAPGEGRGHRNHASPANTAAHPSPKHERVFIFSSKMVGTNGLDISALKRVASCPTYTAI